MTKKHFNALAEAIRLASFTTMKDRAQAACAVAGVCEHANESFSRDRFYAACGVNIEEAFR